ncbi:MAG: c-type cytochrome [Daejeonella sp.]
MRNKPIFLLLFFITALVQFQACDSDEEINYKRYYVNGNGLYEKHCQNCHGEDGTGLARLYPPLTDTTYLIKNKSLLACIIKNGQNKQITIHKESYDGQMPGNETLADIEIAQIIVYVTNSFGNRQGFYEATKVTSDLKDCD